MIFECFARNGATDRLAVCLAVEDDDIAIEYIVWRGVLKCQIEPGDN